jgi:hypothetical protein
VSSSKKIANPMGIEKGETKKTLHPGNAFFVQKQRQPCYRQPAGKAAT